MKREIISEIEKWDRDPLRKPLVLMGARQVGKTWLMNEFSKTNYSDRSVYVNLMDDEALRQQFLTANIDAHSVISLIQLATHKRIVPGETLLIIDEIQESPRALTSLKFFCEQMPELSVIAAGSLLGLALKRSSSDGRNPTANASFPVGKVDFIDVHPMSFREFLLAIGEDMRLELIDRRDYQMLDIQHEELTRLLKHYLFVGGMPEAVKIFAEDGDFHRVRKIQQAILRSYDKDFAKHAKSPFLLSKIRLLWNNIAPQLAKDSKKFIYTALKKGARAREYEEALQWLEDAGMVKLLRRVSQPRMPLKAYEDFSAFKLFMHDVGLLGAMSNLPPRTLLDGCEIFTNFNGSMTEQYVLQELTAVNLPVNYWSSDTGDAEVDFVLQGDSGIYPLEAKAGTNLNAKSLSVYRRNFIPTKSFRTSLSKWNPNGAIHDIPLYALSQLPYEIVESQP